MAAIPVRAIRPLHRPHPARRSTPGVESDKAAAARKAVDGPWSILAPEKDQVMLRDAGVSNPTPFCTGFAFRGRVAHG